MIEFIRAGICSVQDIGRPGYGRMGIPVGGFMDQKLANKANLLVGNTVNEALIEIAMLGPKMIFHKEIQIAIAGKINKLLINGDEALSFNRIRLKPGDIVDIGNTMESNYAYLAVQGGIKSKVILGSRSIYPGLGMEAIKKKTLLPVLDIGNKSNISSRLNWGDELEKEQIISCYEGPEYHTLNERQKALIMNQSFKLSQSISRMGYRMETNPALKVETIISSPVRAGTIQLTPDGTLVVLMRDCQSTGGYARVLQLTKESINRVAQKKIGSEIKFSILRT